MALWYLEGSLDETKMVRKIPVTNFPFVIGRSKSLDMVILGHGISREHAEIFMKSGRLYIRDLGSTNGTFVNNNRVSGDTLLTHNTVIHISQSEFKLTDLEFRESPDEQLTVVVNTGLNAKGAKNRSAREPANAPDARHIHKDKSADNRDAEEVDTVDELSAPLSSEGSSSSRKLPRYFSNENVFIQEGMDHSNRRMHPRREARWPAMVMLKSQQTMQCVTKDFCETGLSLSSSVRIPDQSLVTIELQTFYKGRNRNFSIAGVVKHSLLAAKGFVVGVQIKQCSDSCREFIKKYSAHQI